jgi:hypothetical protein
MPGDSLSNAINHFEIAPNITRSEPAWRADRYGGNV